MLLLLFNFHITICEKIGVKLFSAGMMVRVRSHEK